MYIILLTALMVAADQFTKFLATKYLLPVGTLPFLPGVLQLEYVLNDGAAFSSFSGSRWLLVGVTSVSLVCVAVYLLWKKPTDKLEYFGWVLVLGGGLGNLIDRIISGVVVDFFSLTFMNFAVFNVADCFVSVGVGLLFFTIISQEVKAAKQKKLAATQAEMHVDDVSADAETPQASQEPQA